MNELMKLAQNLNQSCICKTLDHKLLKQAFKQLVDDETFKSRPHLFSDTAVFISAQDLQEMQKLVETLERVIHLPGYQSLVLNQCPFLAKADFGTSGVFMGFDFHITPDGPKLIEINTNAGGGLLNLYLAQAQLMCCEGATTPFDLDKLEKDYINMFLHEWDLQQLKRPLKTIAIIDEKPQDQYLQPEFELFAKLFRKHGWECFILDPEQLEKREDGLYFQDQQIDLIYNRLTYFYFEHPKCVSLKEAYLEQKVVVTPNPHHHALYANKLNLALLTDVLQLKEVGAEAIDIELLLKRIPRTLKITSENQEELWKKRKSYFFKPASGYGGKAAYRGDKVTTKVWGQIQTTEYVAQEIAHPGLRKVQVDDSNNDFKLDVRAYAYQGKIQLMASRLYSGQTTNFRTQGGGFAPVFII